METIRSGCKINLLLNVLRRRKDGFHELETVIQPLPLFDELSAKFADQPGIELLCDHREVPIGANNLICRAANAFQNASGRNDGLRIHLKKNIPVAAGLGGGSGNAAAALLILNHLYDNALSAERLSETASQLGSDVPFFLKNSPALAFGRGEKVQPLPPFKIFEDACVILVNPGFGVTTSWAYQKLQLDESMRNSAPVSAEELIQSLQACDWEASMKGIFNSLERPVFKKYPVLEIIRLELLNSGASGALLSGSGATVFGIIRNKETGEKVRQRFLKTFGNQCWSCLLPLTEE